MSEVSYRVSRSRIHNADNKYGMQDEIDSSWERLSQVKQELSALIALPPHALLTEGEKEDGVRVEVAISQRVEEIMETILELHSYLEFYNGLLLAAKDKDDDYELRIEED